MDVLELCEPEVPALGEAPRSVRVDVAAERRVLGPVGPQPVRVEVADVAGEPLVGDVVALRVGRGRVAEEQVHRVDRRHAVALPHEPRARHTGERVRDHVARIGRHHVERAAGVALGRRLEVIGPERAAVEVDPLRVRLMDHEPHPGARNPVGGMQRAVERHAVSADPVGGEPLRHRPDAGLGERGVTDGPVAGGPPRDGRIRVPAGGTVVADGSGLAFSRRTGHRYLRVSG